MRHIIYGMHHAQQEVFCQDQDMLLSADCQIAVFFDHHPTVLQSLVMRIESHVIFVQHMVELKFLLSQRVYAFI